MLFWPNFSLFKVLLKRKITKQVFTQNIVKKIQKAATNIKDKKTEKLLLKLYLIKVGRVELDTKIATFQLTDGN